MPAKSVAQRKFMGMVRATQKGEMKNPSPELKRAAGDMSAKAVNKFAKTKEKNLPQKVEEEKKNCGCGKDPCITYGPKKNAHKMPDGTIMPGKTHKEAYAVQAMTVVPGGADHSNTRQGSIGKKKKKEDIKEFVGAAAAGTAGALTAKKGNRVKKAVGSGAGYAVGSTVGRKVGGAVGQAVGAGTVPLVGGAIGKQVGKAIGHGVGGAAGAIAGGKLATKIGKKKEKKETNEEIDRPYTGPDKKDRAVIKKMDNRKFAAKLADYEKNMDPKKRQALKDKATKGMKFVHEEGAPTMSTGSNASAAGFSSDADENGPTAGMDQPLGGTAKLKGKGPKLTKKKVKCKKAPDGINKVCESSEARYLSFLVQMDDVEFIFQGKSPADVKIRLRKIYRPERLKGIKITRMLPAQVMHYYWEKRQAAM